MHTPQGTHLVQAPQEVPELWRDAVKHTVLEEELQVLVLVCIRHLLVSATGHERMGLPHAKMLEGHREVEAKGLGACKR